MYDYNLYHRSGLLSLAFIFMLAILLDKHNLALKIMNKIKRPTWVN